MRYIISIVLYNVNRGLFSERGLFVDINAIVAGNLRELRERKNLSLDQTAKLTSVSKSMLGQIERNEVTPTITVLWKIANGFKISFTALISAKASDASVCRLEDVEPLTEDEGRFINYPTFPFAGGRPFECYRIVIKPRGGMHAEPHLPGSEELITVFAGEVLLTAGQQEFRLARGDAIRFKADVPHAYANPGLEDAELSMVIYYP